VYPNYLPSPFPPPTHYAAIDDVAAVPYLNDAGREGYRAFLRRSFTRAFVVAPNGTSVGTNGGFDAIARGLALCRQHASGCQVYAVDDDVVWNGKGRDDAKPATPPPFERTMAADTSAVLNFAYGVNRDCSSRGLPKLRIVQQPAHGSAKVEVRSDFPRFPAGTPFAVCNATKVPGVSVEYTPQSGFRGTDALTFEETTLENQDRVLRFAITVK
jgi:hypothetical protein